MYYRAQLAHYGLRDYKSKESAKKCLLRGIEYLAKGVTELSVPPSVLRDQERLKELWIAKQEAKKLKDAQGPHPQQQEKEKVGCDPN